MPYVLISTHVRLETGSTYCGDEESDPQLMAKLGAILQLDSGKNFKLYESPHSPRIVLNKLEEEGYHLIATSGIGQTCIWTLYKDKNK